MAIITCSQTGTTATQVAKFRPGPPIYVLTEHATVARQTTGLLRGVTASVCSFIEMDKAIDRQIAVMLKDGICKTGDAIVVVTGTIRMKGATNLMRVQYA
jgi:pyruvate kinase